MNEWQLSDKSHQFVMCAWFARCVELRQAALRLPTGECEFVDDVREALAARRQLWEARRARVHALSTPPCSPCSPPPFLLQLF
eukprot:6190958-Pleurochrysis_carterae.AAC.2